MLQRVDPLGPELRLLLACARVHPDHEDAAAIRAFLDGGVDWPRLAQKAIDHGLAELVGHTLTRVAREAVPDDIRNAFRTVIDRTRRKNQALFEELAAMIEALARAGVDAIPLKGPVLAIQSYGDLGLRVFGDLDFLIRDADVTPTIEVLHDFGYQRAGGLTPSQFDLIHRLQGQEIIFNQAARRAVEPHTRLTPIKMALDIDYEGLWRRARRAALSGRTMLTLAPEDDLIVLAIHGGKEVWWNIKWACDFAVFLSAHPQIDWTEVLGRARAQGCLSMVLLATSLARRCFRAAVPALVVQAEEDAPFIEALTGRIIARWRNGKPSGPPSNNALSLDRLRLHDGGPRRLRYAIRTMFMPGPHHVAAVPLPKSLLCYVPLKIAHDALALPVWRACVHMRRQARLWQDALAASWIPLPLLPVSGDRRRAIRRRREAHREAKRAVYANPYIARNWCNLGDALGGLQQYAEAIACYDKALTIEPDNPTLWTKRRAAMKAAGKLEFGPDLAPETDDARAWATHAGRLFDSKRYVEASEASDRALALDPNDVTVARLGIQARLFACDWQRRARDGEDVRAATAAGRRLIAPVFHRAICDSEAEHLEISRLWARGFIPLPQPMWTGERYSHRKIRVAYVSTDFRDHVVADAIAGCFEHHDRSRFEITGISLHPSDGSAMRRRLEGAFDRFVDAECLSNTDAAAMLRQSEIDIAVDLNGNSGAKRTGIFTRRPAPVQVNFLGYPGTMGGPFVDYIVADRVVIPPHNQIHYTESVVYLPHSYFPNDGTRAIADRTPTRAEAGLPDHAFVFACHNAAHKLSPETFDVWMRLLRTIDGSVLWLKSLDPAAMRNLWREADARGVSPERLVFAPRLPSTEDHLARLRLADLFLDTLPYNAHATASDALWAGLPVLTCIGNAFPGRVAASLLFAVGLPELVTTSLAEYEALALALAQDASRLAALKRKLRENRETWPLFDTAGFTRSLEAAYLKMWERQQAGLSPAGFSV